MSVYVKSFQTEYRVYHESLYDVRPTYPLGGVMEAQSMQEADALAEFMEGLFVDE